jgi:LPS-assembly lipoprotein
MSRARSSTSCSRRAALAAGLALAGGCGFRPIYADRAGTGGGEGEIAEALAATRVALIPEREGQLLREALNARLRNRTGAARHELRVALSITRQALGVRRDETSSRIRLAAVASFTLAPLPSGDPLTTGRSYAVDAFNIATDQYFAAQLSGEAAERRLAERLAEDIVAQLAAFYARRAAGS